MNYAHRITVLLALASVSLGSFVLAEDRQAPPGTFKDLDDEIAGDALIIHGKQLFIDDYLIEELSGVKKNSESAGQALRQSTRPSR